MTGDPSIAAPSSQTPVAAVTARETRGVADFTASAVASAPPAVKPANDDSLPAGIARADQEPQEHGPGPEIVAVVVEARAAEEGRDDGQVGNVSSVEHDGEQVHNFNVALVSASSTPTTGQPLLDDVVDTAEQQQPVIIAAEPQSDAGLQPARSDEQSASSDQQSAEQQPVAADSVSLLRPHAGIREVQKELEGLGSGVAVAASSLPGMQPCDEPQQSVATVSQRSRTEIGEEKKDPMRTQQHFASPAPPDSSPPTSSAAKSAPLSLPQRQPHPLSLIPSPSPLTSGRARFTPDHPAGPTRIPRSAAAETLRALAQDDTDAGLRAAMTAVVDAENAACVNEDVEEEAAASAAAIEGDAGVAAVILTAAWDGSPRPGSRGSSVDFEERSWTGGDDFA